MINFDQLVIDRVLDGWFESQADNSVLAVLDQIQNFQIAVTSPVLSSMLFQSPQAGSAAKTAAESTKSAPNNVKSFFIICLL